MDRGVIVGGVLIAASFFGAMLLNRSADEEAVPVVVAPPPAAQPCDKALAANDRLPGAQALVDAGCDPEAAKSLPGKTRIGASPVSEPPENP
jgi:hypothetical protein